MVLTRSDAPLKKRAWPHCALFRGVVPGGAMAPTDFGTSVNPISTREGGRLCPSNSAGTPGFSDLPMALLFRRIDLTHVQ